ncbi:hypothetical protein ACLOJK_009043 [Asimina triloba]
MPEICCGVVNESDSSVPWEPSSRAARHRRTDLRRFKFAGGSADGEMKSRKGEELEQASNYSASVVLEVLSHCPKHSMSSVCERRHVMEDAVSIHPSLVVAMASKR